MAERVGSHPTLWFCERHMGGFCGQIRGRAVPWPSQLSELLPVPWWLWRPGNGQDMKGWRIPHSTPWLPWESPGPSPLP